MKKYDLLAVGGVYVDVICLDMPFDGHGLAVEQEVVGPRYELTLGGSALNFNRMCTKLGLSTVMIGKIGDDQAGRMLQEMIRAAGIKPELAVGPEVATNIGINQVNPAGQAIMTSAGSANQALTIDEVLERAEPLLEQVECVYLGTCLKLKRLLPAYESLAERAQATGTKIIVDHGRLNPQTTPEDLKMVRELVRHADYYLPSRQEFLQVWEADSLEAGLTGRDWDQTQVIVKDGADGAVALQEGKIVHVPAFPAKPVNTVGAGDSFNAGVIAGVLGGAGLEAAMRLGCATAALKISRPGLPTRAEADELAANKATSA